MHPVLFAVLLAQVLNAGYLEVRSSGGGTISGKISYDGKARLSNPISITTDRKYCGATREDDSWLIAADGGVKNVVIYLSDIKSGKPMAAPQKLVLNQSGCRYLPRMSVVAQGAEMLIKSSDMVLHNVHSYREGTTLFNVAVPPSQSFPISKKLDKPGGIKLKCDVHNFMRAAIFVALNPYYAITDDDGTFEISDVPAGTYTINTWHEAAGPLSERVTVSDRGKVAWNHKIR
jgi:hypothetical protein